MVYCTPVEYYQRNHYRLRAGCSDGQKSFGAIPHFVPSFESTLQVRCKSSPGDWANEYGWKRMNRATLKCDRLGWISTRWLLQRTGLLFYELEAFKCSTQRSPVSLLDVELDVPQCSSNEL